MRLPENENGDYQSLVDSSSDGGVYSANAGGAPASISETLGEEYNPPSQFTATQPTSVAAQLGDTPHGNYVAPDIQPVADTPASTAGGTPSGTAASSGGGVVATSGGSTTGSVWTKASSSLGSAAAPVREAGTKAAAALGLNAQQAETAGALAPWLLAAVLAGILTTVYALRRRIFSHTVTI